jgi:hypothetical protein
MRKDATINEWKQLYELTTRIKELEPWENFWDLDIIGIREGAEEDTAFISTLGRGGDCYGLSIYEGYEGLNDFLMLTMQEKMNVSVEYAMFSQNNLSCYWGNREELSEKQRSIIKELGYRYRGKNQWLYFMSYQSGYYPYDFNQEEVQKMIRYLTRLIEALEYYYHHNLTIDFEHGNMYLFSYDQNTRQWVGCERELPFTMYQFQNLVLTDDKLMQDLHEVKKSKFVLEADIVYLGVSVNDKKYERPGNPRLCLVGDSSSGMILKSDMIEPEEDANVNLVEEIIGFILMYGAPKEIRVSNVIVEATLEQICELSEIKLRRVKSLPTFTQLLNGMRRY